MKNTNAYTHKIATGILSFGMSGRVFHAPFIQHHPGFDLVGIVERTKNDAAALYPDATIYQSVDALLQNKAIALVVVNTPTHTHFDFAKKALEAGKHVIVEKAFTTTAAEAKTLTALADSLGLVLSVYQNRRWDSDFSTVLQMIQSKQLGDIHTAAFQFDRFKTQLSVKLHKETPNAGAGLLLDLGPHLIDQALYAFGMPQAVSADIRCLRPHSQVDDDFTIILYYPTLRVTLKSSLLVKEPLPAFVLHGTKGSFIKQRADVQEAALINQAIPFTEQWGEEPATAMGLLHIEKDGQDYSTYIPTLKGNYGAFYEGMYQTIAHQAACLVTGQDGWNVMTIIEAAQKSHAQQSVVNISV